MSKNVVYGFLGTSLDAGKTEKRWERWRPTVGLFAPGNPAIDRLELLVCKDQDLELAQRVVADIAQVSPATKVLVHNLNVPKPFNFPSMYAALQDFALKQTFVEDEQYFVHLSTGTHVAQISLFRLTEKNYFPAKYLSNCPAEEAQAPWHGHWEAIDLDLESYDELALRVRQERERSTGVLKGGIETRNPEFNDLISKLEKVCLRSRAPVLLLGPPGAGKTRLARRIFDLRESKRPAGMPPGRFVEVNCAVLRGDNAMSALFGHKKGAFTGATADRAGLLLSAHKGTLFLDEIGDLGLEEQAMLLRAIESKRILPLGADTEIESDFLLIAGTNKNLAEEVPKGRFREDLYARIKLWTFTLPGLAARKEDIEPNLDYELECAGQELGMRVTMTQAARKLFLSAAHKSAWPDNFRGLKACVERMATLATNGCISGVQVEGELAYLLPAEPATPKVECELSFARKVLGSRLAELDLGAQAEADVTFAVIARSRNMAEAGRTLYAASSKLKSSSNDSSRLRKYLLRLERDLGVPLEFPLLKAQLQQDAAEA